MSSDVTLKRTEKNQVFEAVLQFGFSVGDFEWSEAEETAHQRRRSVQCRVSIVTHRPTGYSFIFGGFHVRFSPGYRGKVDSEEHLGSWDLKLAFFRTWLQQLKREVDAPDLWTVAAEDANFFQLSSTINASNTPFSSDEQTYISARLDAMRDFILASAQLADGQRQLVEAQIEFTKEATKRLGRFDWKALFVGTLMSLLMGLVANAVFEPDRARQLFHMAADAFTPLFTNLLGLEP